MRRVFLASTVLATLASPALAHGFGGHGGGGGFGAGAGLAAGIIGGLAGAAIAGTAVPAPVYPVPVPVAVPASVGPVERSVGCHLQRGDTHVDGICHMTSFGGGDFSITSYVAGYGNFYARVAVIEPHHLADGFWGRGEQPIGQLLSNNACWDSMDGLTRICAWKLGEHIVLPPLLGVPAPVAIPVTPVVPVVPVVPVAPQQQSAPVQQNAPVIVQAPAPVIIQAPAAPAAPTPAPAPAPTPAPTPAPEHSEIPTSAPVEHQWWHLISSSDDKTASCEVAKFPPAQLIELQGGNIEDQGDEVIAHLNKPIWFTEKLNYYYWRSKEGCQKIADEYVQQKARENAEMDKYR